MVQNGKLYPGKRSSKEAFSELIKSGVASIGLDRTLYSGHSCRAGGATDLFAAGVPYYVVKRYGRWKSDAALIYYRCETSIARCAAKAFERWTIFWNLLTLFTYIHWGGSILFSYAYHY